VRTPCDEKSIVIEPSHFAAASDHCVRLLLVHAACCAVSQGGGVSGCAVTLQNEVHIAILAGAEMAFWQWQSAGIIRSASGADLGDGLRA
jgi:hypothetical protein